MKNICIVNSHWSNRGDEAALRPIINAILTQTTDTVITVIFKDRHHVKCVPYVERVRYFSAQFLPDGENDIFEYFNTGIASSLEMKKEIDCIKESDLILYAPGGAVISDKFWWRKQVEYLTPFICAKEFNIPIVVCAPSMGPFDNSHDRNTLRNTWLAQANRMIVREPMSEDFLRQSGLTNNIFTTIDTAFYDNPPKELCEKIFIKDNALVDFFSTYNEIIGVTLSDFSWHVELSKQEGLQEQIEKTIYDFLNQMKLEGKGILLIPQLFGNQNDYNYLFNFAKEINVIVLSDMYDTYFQQYVISKCYAVVGMRYHSCIFAAKAGVPFIAIGYEEKMYGFMKRWDFDDYLIKIRELDINLLLQKWELIMREYEAYRKRLICYREVWRDKASETIDTIIDVINDLSEGN